MKRLRYYYVEIAIILAMAVLLLFWANVAHAERVDVNLVLAVDVSTSVNGAEAKIQRIGYVKALTHPAFMHAVHSGLRRKIALSYVEWAGIGRQTVILPWTVIDDVQSAKRAAQVLARTPVTSGSLTSISSALAYSQALLDESPHHAERDVIDVSGDGKQNEGAEIGPIRDKIVASGTTINGLPIMIALTHGNRNVDRYYAEHVIGGLGSFVLPIDDVSWMVRAILQKLVLEVASR